MQHRKYIVVLALALWAAACARAYAPPGGERDTQPPRLIATTPGPLAVVPGFTGPVVFAFDERLSERNFSEALVTVSPQDGAVRVERRRTEVRVRMDGGWRPDRIYRVVLLPGVRDLFGNARTEPAEIVFSTGPPVPQTAIAGIVLDRITGRPPQNGVVDAVRRGDDVAYVATTDTAGFFALRHLPLGIYDLRAYGDGNRNRRRDPSEPVDSGRVARLGAPDDTVTVIFSVLPPDTTPPRVTRAEAVDSLRVRITVDDYVDGATPLDGSAAEVFVLPDSVRFAGARRLLPAALFDREVAAERATAERAAAAAADTGGARPPAPPAPPVRRVEPPRPLLPTRDVTVELDRPLEPGREYVIVVRGIENVHGLVGGGSATFETRPAREPPPVRPDTLPVRPDTLPVRPDTLPLPAPRR
jgi:hypothetical protein